MAPYTECGSSACHRFGSMATELRAGHDSRPRNVTSYLIPDVYSTSCQDGAHSPHVASTSQPLVTHMPVSQYACICILLLRFNEFHALVELALLASVVHVNGSVIAHHPCPHLARLALLVWKLHAVDDYASAGKLALVYHFSPLCCRCVIALAAAGPHCHTSLGTASLWSPYAR